MTAYSNYHNRGTELTRFDIRQHIELPQHRSTGNTHVPCPSCQSPDARNPALSINLESGAYHCFKCEGEKNGEIRKALGQAKDQIVPTALAAPASANTTVSPQEIRKNNEKLINESRLGKDWLLKRGFSLEMMAHYRLGIKRCKKLNQMWWCISIPIPANADRTQYHQKLRIEPWAKERPEGLKSWDQAGIQAQVWFTYLPDNAVETYLCEGEWDAMLLGWQARKTNSNIAIATFTCGCETVPSKQELQRLPGRVTIFYDRNDKPIEKTGERPGDRGAKKVARALGDRAWIAEVPQGAEHAEINGWDVSDAVNAGFTMSDFQTAAQEAKQPTIELRLDQNSTNPLKQRLVTNAQLMARAPDYIDWLVPDMLPSDELFVLAAGPRSGKSLLAMSLARCVATGEKFLGRACTQGAVLYVNLEDSDAKIKQRELAQQWDFDLPIYWLDRFKLSEVADLKELAEELDVRLIVLDTFSRIRDDERQESSAEISRHLEPLQQMANELKTAVLLIHHTTKVTTENAGNINVFDTIRGSSAIRAVSRGSWILARGERCYRLCIEHGFGENQDLEILLDPETMTWKSIRPWNPKQTSAPQEILNYLNAISKATIPEISAYLSLNPNTVNVALWRLQADDLVWKQGGKKGQPAVFHRSFVKLSNAARENDDARGCKGIARESKGIEIECNPDSVTVSGENMNSLTKRVPGQKQDQNSDPFSQNQENRNLVRESGFSPETLTEQEKNSLTIPLQFPYMKGNLDHFSDPEAKILNNGCGKNEADSPNAADSPEKCQKTETYIEDQKNDPEPKIVNNATKKQKPLPKLKLSDQCKYVGPEGAMAVSCRGRSLEILEIRHEEGKEPKARIKAKGWACDYWVPCRYLRHKT